MFPDVPVPGLQNLAIALSDAEYDVASILSFDPDASVLPGSLATYAHCERPHQLSTNAMNLPAWLILARACLPDSSPLDPLTCLFAFVAVRGAPAEVAR